jgi:V-type H+-transporting ATPase subunit H
MSRASIANPSLTARAPAEVRAAEAAEAERELREMEAEQQYAKSIQTREIPWSSYEQNKLITKNELALLLEFDKNNNVYEVAKLLEEKGCDYAALFIKCLNTIQTKETTEYVIVLIDSLLTSSSSTPAATTTAVSPRDNTSIKQPYPRARLFHALESNMDIYQPFNRIVLNPAGTHSYILARTQIILAILLSTFTERPELDYQPSTTNGENGVAELREESQKSIQFPQIAAKTYLKNLSTRLISEQPASRGVLATLSALKICFRSDKLSSIFVAEDGIKGLASAFIKENGNAQLIYAIGFNLWLLSYKSANCVQMSQQGIFKRIVAILKVSVMEKVIRILFNVVRNAIDVSTKLGTFEEDAEANARIVSEECIGLGLVAVAETLYKRKYKDSDITPDIEAVTSILGDTVKRLSTFDLYSSEVQSGNLSWTPAHTNEIFWRENITQFEERNYKLIAKLIEVLADEDDTVREIACHDLGEYARFAPEGKRVISKLGGKAKLMANLQHKNPKVAKAALLATQKLMVANWEYLAKNSTGGVAALVSKSAKVN